MLQKKNGPCRPIASHQNKVAEVVVAEAVDIAQAAMEDHMVQETNSVADRAVNADVDSRQGALPSMA
jgi:hypothetical protein